MITFFGSTPSVMRRAQTARAVGAVVASVVIGVVAPGS